MKTFNTIEELDAAIRSFLSEDDYTDFRELTRKRGYKKFLQERIDNGMEFGIDQLFTAAFPWYMSKKGIGYWVDIHIEWQHFLAED